MSERQDDSMLFVAEWFDPLPQMKKRYLLKYFVDLNCAEMVDLKSKKMFLKKSPCPPHVSKDDFYVGARVLLYSRELDIVDYGDLKTRERLHRQIHQCVLVLPTTIYSQWGKIVDEVLSNNLTLVQAKTVQLSANIADRIVNITEDSPRRSSDIREGTCLVVLFHGEDGFGRVESIATKFQQQANAYFVYAKSSQQSTDLQAVVLQDASLGSTATLDHCTCCVIKPHAVRAKQTGQILDVIISQGYEISAARTLQFDKVQAEEFLEVYKGVIPEYSDQVVQLCSGLCLALEIRAQDAVETFRVTAGPWDVDMAKEIRPDSIRGRFGTDRVLNAVHCTDLPDDAELECEYCFQLL